MSSRLKGKYISECLEIITLPNICSYSIERYFEREKMYLKERLKNQEPIVLRKSQNEIVYKYSHPTDHFIHNAIIRSFTTNKGYYSIAYRIELSECISEKEVERIEKLLQEIDLKEI